MVRYALYGMQVGLFLGACYWFADTLIMFAVLAYEMSNPSSGLVPESLWLLFGSVCVYGTLGLLSGATLGLLFGGPVPALEQKLSSLRDSGLLDKMKGPVAGLRNIESTFVMQIIFMIMLPVHILLLVVSPEFDLLMGVGLLTIHAGLALFVVLTVIWLDKPIFALLAVALMMGGWVKFQDKGMISSWMAPTAPQLKASAESKGKPNVVWVVSDTTRLDHLSLYGYERDTTPFLDGLAKEAAVFESAYSTAPWTLASHAGMFSGMFSARSRATHESLFLSFENSTLAEGLEAVGYETKLMAGNPWLQNFTGLGQGYQEIYPSWRSYTVAQVFVLGRTYIKYLAGAEDKGARWSNEMASAALDARGDDAAPFFYFFNYLEAHAPYHQIPDDYAMMYQGSDIDLAEVDQVSRNIMSDMMFSTGYKADDRSLKIALANYDGGIRYVDDKIKELFSMLDEAGELDNTIFIFASDHGELFGKDGIWGHELSLDDSLIHIPLLVWKKGGFPGGAQRVKTPVQLNDVLPTVLELVGASEQLSDSVQGSSLVPLLKGQRGSDRPVYAEYYTPTHPALKKTAALLDLDPENLRIRMVQVGNLKYVVGPGERHALYDLDLDPQERKNLIAERSDDVDLLSGLLSRFVAESEAGAIGGVGGAPKMDEATKQQLCALGYLECD